MDYYIKKNDVVNLMMKVAKSHDLSFSAEAYERAANLTACMPNEEVQPVRHGRWIPQGDDMWLCSNCKENKIFSMHESDRAEKQRYCCRCGARMDGET